MVADIRIATLRRRIMSLETAGALGSVSLGGIWPATQCVPLAFGFTDLDAHFTNGGLGSGTHQIAGTAGDPVSAETFGFVILARYLKVHSSAQALIVRETSAIREAGTLYGPGLLALGVDPDRLTFLQTRDSGEALRAAHEALRARVPEVLVVELCDGASLADLSVTRRFNLAAHKAGTLLLLMTPDLSATSAALTRWRVASLPTASPRRRLGAPTFALDLVRNRHGRTGRWNLEWNSHDRVFRPLPALAPCVGASTFDRSGSSRMPILVDTFGAHRQAG